MADPLFFGAAADWRAWLQTHHLIEPDCLVGFIKVTTGGASLSWSESVDEALCFGWIDGVRRRIDERTYSIRFTPRKAGSNWSAVNCAKVERLAAAGLMTPAGLAAYARRTEGRTAVYSYERAAEQLSESHQAQLRADPAAWAVWSEQAAWYRRNATLWINGAKRPKTRDRRFAELISDSAAGRRVRHLRSDR